MSTDSTALSLWGALKQATRLYFKGWRAILVFLASLFVLSISFAFSTLILPENIFLNVETLDNFNSFSLACTFLVFFLICIFCVYFLLVLTGYYDLKLSQRNFSVKDLLKQSLKKSIPSILSAICFGIIWSVSIGLIFSLSILLITTNDFVSESFYLNYITLALSAIFLVIFSGWIFSRLYNRLLFIQAIMLDDKSIIGSIRYSAALCKGWRSSWGTFFIMTIIYLVSPIAQGICFIILYMMYDTLPDFAIEFFYSFCLLVDVILFPWYLSCHVCWYRNLQKRKQALTV